MEWFLYNIVAAILHAPHELRPTMLSINLMLSIQNYRRAVLKHVNDPEILRFFKDEFDKATPRELREILRPIQNKIGKIVASPFVHNMVSPYKPAFQFKDAIAKRKIVIIRLPKGTLGETAAKLLGSMIVSNVITAAQAQDAFPEEDRIPHYLAIDEKHILPTKALIPAFSEARKYKLGILLTTQYLDQMPREEVLSMMGNIGNIIAMRCSEGDAERFHRQIRTFPQHRYVGLSKGQAIARLVYKGSPLAPVEIGLDADVIEPVNKSQQIIKYVREKYTKPRQEVEAAYLRWLRKMILDPAQRKKQKEKVTEQREKKKRVVYSHINGKDCTMKIEPDGSLTKLQDRVPETIQKEVINTAKKYQAKQPRYPVFKVPTRRRRRRPGRNYQANN